MNFNDFVRNLPSFVKVYDAKRDGFVLYTLTPEGNRYVSETNLTNNKKTFLSLEKVYQNAVTFQGEKPLYVDEIKMATKVLVR